MSGPPETTSRHGWYVASLLALAYLVSTMDRYILAVVLEDVKAQFELTDTQLGVLLGPSFVLLFTVASLPFGRLADSCNRKVLVSSGLILWSLEAFLRCPAEQLWSFQTYTSDLSPFSTQQGIKGAEFPRVLVVLDDEEGSSHTQFSYEKYFGIKPPSAGDLSNVAAGKETAVHRTRRLFYVCCTRALTDLVVVMFSPDAAAAEQRVRALGIFPADAVHGVKELGI